MIQDIYPHRLQNEFRVQQKPEKGDPVFFFAEEERETVLCRVEEGTLILPVVGEEGVSEVSTGGLLYLFSLDGRAHWLAGAGLPAAASAAAVQLLSGRGEPSLYDWHALRKLRFGGAGPKERIFAAYTASQLWRWYRDNRYCGTCGKETVPAGDERAVSCPACGRKIYPRIQPAVIVGVTNGDEIVLTRYTGRPITYHALVAGFVEIGETVEETVAREVMEEVGLRVKNIRYYKSQPWATADDLLVGFYCDVDGDPTIHLDRTELKEGIWVRREDVDSQPDDFSLTNEMMQVFKRGEEPKGR